VLTSNERSVVVVKGLEGDRAASTLIGLQRDAAFGDRTCFGVQLNDGWIGTLDALDVLLFFLPDRVHHIVVVVSPNKAHSISLI